VPGGDCDFPGGKLKNGESPQEAAIRESFEEVGYRAGHAGRFLCRRVKNNTDYVTFEYPCEEFIPKLSKEHDAYLWVNPRDVLK
jgi:8-oxo-dGTP pyrophosphatase MutT (NUDIX family)